MPRQPLPHIAHVLGGDGRENQRRSIKTFGVVGGEPEISGQFDTGEKPLVFAVLEQSIDRFLERSPKRDVMSALGEEERTDGGHSAVADDCYAVSYTHLGIRHS